MVEKGRRRIFTSCLLTSLYQHHGRIQGNSIATWCQSRGIAVHCAQAERGSLLLPLLSSILVVSTIKAVCCTRTGRLLYTIYTRDRPTLHLFMHSRISVLHLQSCSTTKIKRLISYAPRVLGVSLLLTIQSFRMICNNVSNAKAIRPNK